MLGKIPHEFPFPDYENEKTKVDVLHTCIKMHQYFREHDAIAVSISGGSDSDCMLHLICKYFPEYINKCKFVFVNAGLEYAATKRHLTEIENHYKIHIDKIRGISVVTACKKYGFPILSKMKSHILWMYTKGMPCGEKYVFYDGIKSYHAMQLTNNQKELAIYLKANNIIVSKKCCDVSKKKPLHEYHTQNGIDLIVTGERKSEGGQRAFSHESCFEIQKNGDHKYMPLWWWSDETKAAFKKAENIRYSDCYEVWGMKRTGCCGCPFNQNISDDLEKIATYEPNLFIACMRVFGQSYYLTDKFNCRRKKCLTPELLQKAEEMGVI